LTARRAKGYEVYIGDGIVASTRRSACGPMEARRTGVIFVAIAAQSCKSFRSRSRQPSQFHASAVAKSDLPQGPPQSAPSAGD
jgi:hypothetical protein